MASQPLDRLFVEQARDYLSSEYPAKLRIAIAALPQDKLWWRPNEDSNSVGNLLLHLNGNIRQWIVAGVGGDAYERHRADEFAAREGRPASELLTALERTLGDVDRILGGLSADRLAERCAIQGRDITVLDAIFHVTEHFCTTWDRSFSSSKCSHPVASTSMRTPAGWRARSGINRRERWFIPRSALRSSRVGRRRLSSTVRATRPLWWPAGGLS